MSGSSSIGTPIPSEIGTVVLNEGELAGQADHAEAGEDRERNADGHAYEVQLHAADMRREDDNPEVEQRACDPEHRYRQRQR